MGSRSSGRRSPVCAVQVDLRRPHPGQGGLDVAGGPAGPPAQVGDRARAERGQPPAYQLRSRGLDLELRHATRQPRLDRRPPPLGARPRTTRAAPDDPAFRGEQEQHPGGDVLVAAVGLALGHPHPRTQPWLVGGELCAGSLAPCGQCPRRGLLDVLEPGSVTEASALDQLGVPAPLRSGDRESTGRLQHRCRLGRDDEHRPPHGEHPQQRAVGVQSPLDVPGRGGVAGAAIAGPGRDGQEDGGRVGGVQGDHGLGCLDRAGGLRATRQAVAAAEPGAAFLDTDASHPNFLPPAADNAGWLGPQRPQALLAFAGTVAQGTPAAPIGSATVSVVDTRESAGVAAAVLTGAGHSGRTYTLTGPRAMTHDEWRVWSRATPTTPEARPRTCTAPSPTSPDTRHATSPTSPTTTRQPSGGPDPAEPPHLKGRPGRAFLR